MREKSYSLSKENSQQPKDIRGGEKKVMKKSLSAILSLAMAFSMFSSVAFGAEAAAKKTSADFDDLKDLTAEQKVIFDAMISGGIFDGVADKTFGLKDKMNRAQFAKVAALIFDLKVDTSLKTSSFSDVKADDPANGYALPYIEALKAAGLTDGYAPGQYNPAGEVTKQELATFLVRGLGWEAEAKASAGVNDKTVSDWAKGYVAVAIEKKIMTSGEDGTFGGTSAATRDLLVLSSYAADKAYVPAGKVSVTGAKATGVQKVEVTFNKPVDTAKAKLSLKRGSTDIAVDAKFADDKKSAVLTLKDVKIIKGDYTVTLSGLEADAVAETTAKFSAEDETVQKISFTNPSDTIAYADKVRVQFAATNQYDEPVSMSAGAFSVFATSGSPVIKKTEDGDLFVELKTNEGTIAQNVSQISINVYDNSRNMSASKIFKVGTAPYISKIELKAPKYSNNGEGLSKAGEYAKVPLAEYDQYGNVMVEGMKSVVDPSGIITPNLDLFDEIKFAYNSDGIREAEVKLKKDADQNGDYTLSVYGGTSAATATIKTVASKVAAKVELATDATYAEGDTDKYVTLVAYDVNGNKLSQDDIVENAKDGRFTLTASGAFSFGATSDVPSSILDAKNGAIVLAGENKGKIHLANVGKGTGYIFAAIYSTTGGQTSTAQQTYSITSPRYPVSFKVNGDDLATKAVAGATTEVKLKLYDQNGDEIKKVSPTADLKENGKPVTYDVYVKPDNANFTVTVDGNPLRADGKYGTDEIFDKKIKVATAGATAGSKLNLKVSIRKYVGGVLVDDSVKTYSKEISIIDASKENLTYAIAPIGDIFAAIDDKTQDGDFDNAAKALQAKEVKLTAKDSGGNVVAVDSPTLVKDVTSSVYNSAVVAKAANGKSYVLGNKAGTSTISLLFTSAKGESLQVSTTVTTKTDPVTVDTITAGKASKVDTLSNLTGKKAKDLMELKIKDNYGVSYNYDDKDRADQPVDSILLYDKQLQVRYGVTDVQVKNKDITGDANVVKVDENGVLTIGSNVASFNLYAYANGKSVQTAIVVQ